MALAPLPGGGEPAPRGRRAASPRATKLPKAGRAREGFPEYENPFGPGARADGHTRGCALKVQGCVVGRSEGGASPTPLYRPAGGLQSKSGEKTKKEPASSLGKPGPIMEIP